MEYLIAKWLHILSSTLVFGTGIGSAFHMLMASLRRDPAVAAQVVRQVVWADWLFTTTTMIFQPLSGWYLAHLMGLPVLQTKWLAWSLALRLSVRSARSARRTTDRPPDNSVQRTALRAAAAC